MQTAGGAGRLLGLLFLAIVVVAIAALLAGYGVPVGVGALAGLILGAIAGALGSLWLGRGAGRSINLGGVAWSSSGYVSKAPSGELLGQMAGGLSVQLVAIEIHEAGAALTVDVRPLPGALPPPSVAQVSVIDDVGTRYQASGQGQGGGPNRMRYEIAVIPAPSPASSQLVARIDRFVDLFPGARRVALGPWTFTVPLPSLVE